MNAVAWCTLALTAWAGPGEFNKYLYPESTNILVIVDLQKVRRSPLFTADMQAGFDAMINQNDQVKRLAKMLDFDPSRDLSTFTMCGNGKPGGDDDGLIIVNGQFPYDKLTVSFDEMVDGGEITKVQIEEMPVYYTHKAREAFFFTLIDGNTVVLSKNRKTLGNAIEGLSQLREPGEELAARLDAADGDGEAAEPAVQIAGLFPEDARRQMGRVPQLSAVADELVGYSFKAAFGSPSRFRGVLTLKSSGSAEAAKNTFEQLKGFGVGALRASGQRSDLVELLEGMQLGTDDENLTVRVDVPEELMTQIVENNRSDRDRRRTEREKRRQEHADG